jgi:hypothetical protein
MLAILIAVLLIALCVVAIYLLLRSMGRGGIEAAAPGSCRSGRCGVQPRQDGEGEPVPLQTLRMDQIKRLDRLPNPRDD